MASNNGQRLTVFGLTYGQHDNRSMLRILREHSQPPANPGNRAELFAAISALAKELDDENAEGIKTWLASGAVPDQFPSSIPATEREFGHGPLPAVQTPDIGQPPAPGPTSNFGPPRNPLGRSRGYGRGYRGVGTRGGRGGHPAPHIHPLMPMPAFMGDGDDMGHWQAPGHGHRAQGAPGMPAFNPYNDYEFDSSGAFNGFRSAAFRGAGNSLVDTDTLVPEFPTANAPRQKLPLATSTADEGEPSSPEPRMDPHPPVVSSMEEMTLSFAEFQHRERRTLGKRTGADSDQVEDDDMTDSDEEIIPDRDDNENFSMTDFTANANRIPRPSVFDPVPGLGQLRRPARTASSSENVTANVQDAEGAIEDSEYVIAQTLLECCICAESLPPTNFPDSPLITSTCKHEDDSLICLHCIEQSIRVPVDSGVLNLLNCPMCSAKLSTEEVKRYATPRVFARYQYLLMSLNPDMVFCLARGCGHGQIHSFTENPVMVCEVCSFKTCVKHKLPWHEGQTCEEFDTDDSQLDRLEQNEATARLLSKMDAKVCPTCKQGVHRTEGCDHLMCRCGGTWCFVCLANWENIIAIGPEAHATTCFNHPRHVPLSNNQKQSNAAKILESVHGGKVSDALLKARQDRNVRVREGIRPLALEAAEKRAKEEALARGAEEGEQGRAKKQKKTKLVPSWEEK